MGRMVKTARSAGIRIGGGRRGLAGGLRDFWRDLRARSVYHPDRSTMKAPSTESLSSTLRTWRVTPPSDPGFRGATWARIEAAQTTAPTWSVYLRSNAGAWSLALAGSLAVAGFTGRTLGREHTAAERDAILSTYVAAIDARVMSANDSDAAAHTEH